MVNIGEEQESTLRVGECVSIGLQPVNITSIYETTLTRSISIPKHTTCLSRCSETLANETQKAL